MKLFASQRVPESDASVGCSSSAAHDAVLVRVPSDSFHCSHMFIEFVYGFIEVSFLPDHQFVVVPS